jgi:hypothetical protein
VETLKADVASVQEHTKLPEAMSSSDTSHRLVREGPHDVPVDTRQVVGP